MHQSSRAFLTETWLPFCMRSLSALFSLTPPDDITGSPDTVVTMGDMEDEGVEDSGGNVAVMTLKHQNSSKLSEI